MPTGEVQLTLHENRYTITVIRGAITAPHTTVKDFRAMFANSLGILEAIARLGDKATIGAINKMNLHMTRGQVERTLKNLMAEDYVGFEMIPYGRTGKKIWTNTNRSYTNMCIVANAICQRAEVDA